MRDMSLRSLIIKWKTAENKASFGILDSQLRLDGTVGSTYFGIFYSLYDAMLLWLITKLISDIEIFKTFPELFLILLLIINQKWT
jgi:hypothetical protein